MVKALSLIFVVRKFVSFSVLVDVSVPLPEENSSASAKISISGDLLENMKYTQFLVDSEIQL